MKQRRLLNFILVGLAVAWLGSDVLVSLAVDWLWFDAMDHGTIFEVSLLSRAALWGGGFVLAAGFLLWNLRLAASRVPLRLIRLNPQLQEVELSATQVRAIGGLLRTGGVIGVSLLFASVCGAQWMVVQSALHASPFGVTDPVFGRDIGFFVFALPALELARGLGSGLVVTGGLAAVLVYGTRVWLGAASVAEVLERSRAHLLGLGAAAFALSAVGAWLSRFALLSGRRGAVYGAGYADVYGRLPGTWVLVAASGVVAIFLAREARRSGTWRRALSAVGGWVVVSVLVTALWPAAIQSLQVNPNELEVEAPFLERNIAATREAYGLDSIEVRPYEAAPDLSMQDLDDNALTIKNIRVWDTRPLLTTYGQLQEIRLYYDFKDVDVDRYIIDGDLRQVMLSARELNYDNVPQTARSWVNEHFQYTHGYGLTMSPVNVVTEEGLPDFFIQDIPPVSNIDLTIERPEIYYGEMTNQYVLVRTGAPEFDYPLGDENAYTTYAGEGGVELGSVARRALFALHFGSLDLLVSQYLRDDSRILFRRRIQERVARVAPFLRFDGDPYVVVADGRLFWMIDAFTTSDRYPYSEPTASRGAGSFNYIRNSVKVVVDAYHGGVELYIADESDPLIQTFAAVFPDTFKPLAEMPAFLQAQLRYPTDLFDVQANMYRAYHMMNPNVFYNKEDMWEVPREQYDGREQPMESYYLVMKLPGEDTEEFVLLLPFVPTSKDNMISWLAARSDPPHYGGLVLFQFPKQKLVYGPRQIEARIDQDPDISEAITLWSQAGSRVVRGNLLVIPIADALLYVEPLYLQAETSQLPELKRVIVSLDNRIAMRPTLREALEAIFGPTPADAPTARVVGVPAEDDAAHWQGLVTQAAEALGAAEAAQRDGDWAAYGQALDELSARIEALQTLVVGDPSMEPAEAPVEVTETAP